VSVMARNTQNLGDVFRDPRVTVHRGDIRDDAAVGRAIAGAKVVVNLAHGGGGANFEAVRAAMVGGAESVARACLAAGVRRLVYVGSIASLYLGPQDAPVTGATPPDPQESERGDYARAKALADRAMLAMHKTDGLPVVILRPGVVVGEGGPPFHSGVGLYNNEQHCIGWNAGRNPLPFVLAEDVADAVFRAAEAPGVEGKCYNLVGDVRLSAREYTAALAAALGRPLRFHPQSPRFLWAEDAGKWVVKRATGRNVPAPTMRDFLSRGMMAQFDISDAKRDLGWTPVSDPAVFTDRAIRVHA
jgi:nucleoside-diphosphate-sugar epimerase